jgi:hypothetical protein
MTALLNWDALQPVYEAARRAGVSFSIHYSEVADQWRAEVHSAAPSERTVISDGGFDATVARLLEWLKGLS